MSGYECLLSIAGRLVGARYPERREEIVATARAAGRDASAWARLAEVAGLVALTLRPAQPSASLFRLATSDLGDVLAALGAERFAAGANEFFVSDR